MTVTVLIAGATGTTGSAVVDFLESRDVDLRVMVRSAKQGDRFPGARPVVANFDDSKSLREALDGVDRAYLVTPSSEHAQEQQLRFVEQCATAEISHVVKLSQLAADERSPVRFLRYHAIVERRIRELGLGFTFLRPNLFFQGLLGMADTVASQGKLFAPIGDARVSAVDARDIAAVAAAALSEPGHTGKTYDVTGPAAVTHVEIADAIGAAIDREVTFVDVAPAVFADVLSGVLPAWQVDGLVEDYAHYKRGEAADVSPAVAEVTGRAPRDVATFARDFAHAFTKG